ncbi:MAG: hypothetical protein ABSB30_12540 [Terracidiphilus sp.]|jgi:hypothetical protein
MDFSMPTNYIVSKLQTRSCLWQGSGRIFFVTQEAKQAADLQRYHGGMQVASASGKYVLHNHNP